MSTTDHIAWTGYIDPFLQVEVDDKGCIQVAVRAQVESAPVAGFPEVRTSRDGWVRSDVSNVLSLNQALDSAQRFAAAVFPQHPEKYTWQQRAEAYAALGVSGKLGIMKDQFAREVDLFLNEYTQAERLAGDGHRPHMTMEAYAREYERWW